MPGTLTISSRLFHTFYGFNHRRDEDLIIDSVHVSSLVFEFTPFASASLLSFVLLRRDSESN